MAMASAQIQDLWSLESLGIMDKIEPKKEEDLAIEAKKHFQENVRRSDSGRYEVALPWMIEKPELPNNRGVAEKRLLSATKKLKDQGNLSLYHQIFMDWIKEGFIEKVSEDQLDLQRSHYIPHRPVFKPQSLTTPVRPVFDASCKTGRNPSLNDCLYKGPNLIALIPAILYRFREKAIGVSADIRKAFQMIDVRPEDQDYLRFLWWEDPSCNKMVVYCHRRVVFGLTCSPFLLAAALEKQCMEVGGILDKNEGIKLFESLYVDNCVTSVDFEEQFEFFKRFSTSLLAECGMELREWQSGLDRVGSVDILGLGWDKKKDVLFVDIPSIEIEPETTMRKVLSAAHRVFDPVGFLSPVTLQPKLLLQEGWKQKKSFDSTLDEETCKKFRKWCEELPALTRYGIPRQMMFDRETLELHCFVDASKYAYACVVFARSFQNGEWKVNLVHAKSRVAPMKECTIPRLELMACWLGKEVTGFIKKSMNWQDVPTEYHTDTTTAKHWITSKCEWGTFVGNRVKKIMDGSRPEEWRFIPGVINPVDLPSRGCSPKQLLESRWERGPDFLYLPKSEWPNYEGVVNKEEVERELSKKSLTLTTATVKPCWFMTRKDTKISSYQGNVKVMGWVRRFVNNCRRTIEARIEGPLKGKELEEAHRFVLQTIQHQHGIGTREEKGGLQLLEKNGLWCVKTRLLNREAIENFKFPVYLPKDHPLVMELIFEHHQKFQHSGIQILLSRLREKYWVEQGRRTIRKALKKCVGCQRFDAVPFEVEQSSLPKRRVESAEVFETTGVDLAGPLYVNDKSKVWIVIYTCAVYRCVVFDLVTSLSCEAFLLSLERFVNNHGRPSTIYSDNGTNFLGASNLMKTLDMKQLLEETGVKGIRWIFNPPSAPWWGGWWERLIRSAKDLLRRILGPHRLSHEQLMTCLTGVAAAMNDRPLTLVTEDPEDLIPLTPAMFLHPTRNSEFLEGKEFEGSGLSGCYKKTQLLKRLLQERFRSEYLSQLVQRGNEKKSPIPKVGDVVLIGFDNKKRWEWPLGRILELFPGKDEKTRVATVKTKLGILKRPLQRLFPLEIPNPGEIKIPPTTQIFKKEAVGEVPVTTRSGRQVKKPSYYGAWNQ